MKNFLCGSLQKFDHTILLKISLKLFCAGFLDVIFVILDDLYSSKKSEHYLVIKEGLVSNLNVGTLIIVVLSRVP